MSSPMPFHPSMCCICFEGIEADQYAEDEEGNKWDVHKGKCATDAGFTEGVGFIEKES